MLYLIKKELTSNIRYILFGFVIFVAYMFIFAYTDVALFTMCLIISVLYHHDHKSDPRRAL